MMPMLNGYEYSEPNGMVIAPTSPGHQVRIEIDWVGKDSRSTTTKMPTSERWVPPPSCLLEKELDEDIGVLRRLEMATFGCQIGYRAVLVSTRRPTSNCPPKVLSLRRSSRYKASPNPSSKAHLITFTHLFHHHPTIQVQSSTFTMQFTKLTILAGTFLFSFAMAAPTASTLTKTFALPAEAAKAKCTTELSCDTSGTCSASLKCSW
ncbi:hypothetical protein BJ508DRAFT_380141 [Ascobolus immersus RN42]|uniref:Uncharacterized protein n=1 Tax=Ascobolus immersus RN42 TaxID=1160509 RepID=A0A3N4HN71_ASCIM|nr:hypothetical protein BJ508DRAFT_380141 [Ascobolus immersus RN42]